MPDKLVCPRCGNSDAFEERIIDEISVPYVWDGVAKQYKQRLEGEEGAKSDGLYCAKCEAHTPFVWSDLDTDFQPIRQDEPPTASLSA